ncbi:MAG: formamidopyrimidine-DNA glycosylase [Pirellulaceae bacterium]|nr:MAG: formamidopyrimidine-DNA glycosylase [Pirellulaceae bacterium]
MPELPEVEAMRRGLEQAGVPGSTVSHIDFPRTRYRPIEIHPSRNAIRRLLVGRRIESVDRWGKAVLLVFEHQQRLVIEPRMTGLMLICPPNDRQYVRMTLSLEGARIETVYFWDRRGLGKVHLWSEQEFERRQADGLRGPDALRVSRTELIQALGGSRRPIKLALLDQHILSGVGNLYASEILHRARIHPQRACCQLDTHQWQRLHRAMREVLGEAVRCEGSTLLDETYLNVNGKPGRYQYRHRVYQRAGSLCSQCRKGIIQRMVLGQRSTFFCPICQR